MNGELLRLVDSIHRDKNIPKEIVFEGIESALLSAAKKHFGEEEDISITIDRETGNPTVQRDGNLIAAAELGDQFGRIAAQTAKQVMIQKIREAERDALFDEYEEMRGQIVTGTVTRFEGGVAIVNLGKTEALLPRSEQIPGETHHPNERVRAIVLDVRKQGSRVKIILSRTHPDFVRRMFELEIPEIAERVIEIKAIAREAGYRTKVAVSSIDMKVDCVGACVGVRGTRIKNIVDELAGERIDIVRWNESLQVLIPNALQPAEIEEVILCHMLGRAIVLVREDQLSLAIGRRGQNVRLGSKLSGWDIEIMTREELDEQIDRAVAGFSEIPGVDEKLVEKLVMEGFLSYDDLSVIEPQQLAEMGSMTLEQAQEITEFAERESERLEREQAIERQRQKAAEEKARLEAAIEAEQARLEGRTEQAAAGVETAEGAEATVGLTEASAGEASAVPEESPGDEAAANPREERGGAEVSPALDEKRSTADAVQAPTEDIAQAAPSAGAVSDGESEGEAVDSQHEGPSGRDEARATDPAMPARAEDRPA